MNRGLVVVIALLFLAGCSTVPSSSPTVQITQEPPRGPEDVGVEPLEPEEGATAEEIVRGFISAAASTVRTHPVARQYLTSAAAETWSDESGITVIGGDYATVTTPEGRVQITADLVGTVDSRGVFTVGSGQPYRADVALEEVGGEWRISIPPTPEGLLMVQADFEQLYDERAVYFVDPTRQRVVPDLRYLISGEAQPTALMERLLAGPASALDGGVENALTGARLVRAVTVSGQAVTVELAGIADLAAPELPVLCAQVVWTLNQLPGAPSVELLVDGEPLVLDGIPAEQSVEDWSTFDPEAAPVGAVGHFLDPAGALRLTDGEAAPGPAGQAAYALQSAAIAADPRTGELSSMVGTTTRDGAARLLVGAYGGDLQEVLDGETFTAPSVAATRTEFWTVRNGTAVVRVPADGRPQVVNALTLEVLGRASALQLSPDGVRAAVIVNGNQLYVGTVVRDDDGPVELRNLRPVAPSLTGVTDVAWSAPDRLLVLASGEGEDGTAPYSLRVDGWGLAAVPTAGLPGLPISIAAAPGQQPLVTAGFPSSTIWQLSGGTWLTLVRGQQPVPGTEPFFPA
ncbi:LpqB family beta-propeller domain-containing protein [Trujillonella endophytica]|uniref:Sporulation and spore germination n=1 Tax=Trujillonella endophytica TaxID=673521 RepID=A0A1H8RZF8_9ACTN|nr:LpqB family beta-propeller domain-containing protein [Trujillella endophytica]SEO71343.1 Sporulation and spore germination [Trujillella endophytica]